MRVFVTGASGHVASCVIPELLAAGHTVVGLARSDQAADVVTARGAQVWRGELDDVDGLRAAVGEADGVLHFAFKNAEMREGDLTAAIGADLRAIEAMGAALAGSGKPFVGTCATLAQILAGFHGTLTEHDGQPGGPRIDAENAVLALAGQGVRSSLVRLPPSVHSNGRYGFVTSLIEIARTSGMAGYLGDGGNRWPAADTRDVARLYRLALESAPAGARLHAVAEEGIALRDIAEAIGRRLGLPVASIPAGDFGFLGGFAGLDNPASSTITRDLLGWAPTHPGLLADLTEDRRVRS